MNEFYISLMLIIFLFTQTWLVIFLFTQTWYIYIYICKLENLNYNLKAMAMAISKWPGFVMPTGLEMIRCIVMGVDWLREVQV
jgi:hypothetical protein